MKKGSGLIPAFLSLLLSTLILGAVVERTTLVGLFNGHAAASPANTNTGGSGASATQDPVVSAAPGSSALVTVPDIICWRATVAQEGITGAGLHFAAHFAASTAVPRGVVSSTEPPAGREVPLGSVITVTVSTGPPSGVRASNRCHRIIEVLPSGFFVPVTPPAN